MKKNLIVVVVSLIVLANLVLYLNPIQADIVFFGKIHNESHDQEISCLAVKDKKIIFLGSKDHCESLIGKKTQIVKLKKKQLLTAGFTDSHAHFASIGMQGSTIDVSALSTEQEFLEIIFNKTKEMKKGDWIFVQGWHQDKIKSQNLINGFPTNLNLSAISLNNPVLVYHSSFHMLMLNEAGVKSLNLTPTELANKNIIKISGNKPSGIFLESAMDLVHKKLPVLTKEELYTQFSIAQNLAFKNGITSLHDAGISQSEFEALEKFYDENKLKLKLWLMIDGRDEKWLQHWLNQGPKTFGSDDILRVGGIKYFADGALGSRTAYLSHQYLDDPKTRGQSLIEINKFSNLVKSAYDKNFVLAVHAIGDEANHIILNEFEKLNQTKSNIFRIEHAQHLKKSDISRFSKIGVIASMQGVHFTSDQTWAHKRIGHDRLQEGGYAWRKLLDSKATLISGSDAPVESLNPMFSFSSFLNRGELSLTPKEAYDSFTKNPAKVTNSLSGELKVGMFADLVVWSSDFFKETADKVRNIKADLTMINGKIVYQREKLD
jgi:predicted amidohydrolase YtcJ